MPTDAGQLAAAIETSTGLILVLTGAGISLASGIPTFRGSDPGATMPPFSAPHRRSCAGGSPGCGPRS